MFLKSLTLKGFKSFADRTTLDFEPGVTVVVGPNGSGKSNVVDAVAWVLGAQGARALRGGKMHDVIFAGTSQRPALGRAEVSLTIDNTAGLLPIEFSEVTVTRTLFRTGESEYAINGAPCRLLDVQDLLSDSGIGRQQHVIVGQGQLDTVLNARPEDRRAIIEEAAGILKFRKRRERAERRLVATEGNLLRLTDLLREVRRGLRPLERQADAARRHDGLVAELRACQTYLAGRELAGLQQRLDRGRDARAELAAEEERVARHLRSLDEEVGTAERSLSAPDDDVLDEMLLRVGALRERARGLVALVAERRRGIERELVAAADEGVVETLVAEAADLRQALAAAEADWATLAPSRAEVEEAERRVAAGRADLDAFLAGPDGPASAAERRRAAESELAAAEGRVRDARHALARGDEDAGALDDEHARLGAEAATVRAELDGLDVPRRGLEADEAEVAAARAAHEEEFGDDAGPDDELRHAEEALGAAELRLRDAERDAGRAHARAETLAAALDEAHAATGGDALGDAAGVLGPLLDRLRIEPGAELAVAAALGDALGAIVVGSPTAARGAIARLKAGDARALLLVVDAGAGTAVDQRAFALPGTRAVADLVRADDPRTDAALRTLLAGTVLVDGGWEAALDLVLADPRAIAVTRDGDRFGGGLPWRAGSAAASVVTPAALAEAEEAAQRADRQRAQAADALEVTRERLAALRRTRIERAERERAARADLERRQAVLERRRRELEVAHAGLEERRALLERRRSDLGARRAEWPTHRDEALARLGEVEAAHAAATTAVADARAAELGASDHERSERSSWERRRGAAARLRQEFEVRGAGIDERRGGLQRRLAELEARLAARPDEEAAARRRRDELTGRAAHAATIERVLGERSVAIDTLAARLDERRRARTAAAREAGRRLDALRAERADAERALLEVRERASRTEVEEAELRLRLEHAVERCRTELDCEPAAAIGAPLPELAEGVTPAARRRELERELRLLGPVNPLALSEYDALQERHEFLQTQLDDVKATRRELQRVISAVDQEIVTRFEAAFADVARHFADLFATLFPGGSGRLVLSDPADLLGTGVEMEARPSGKNVRRLSLLSGGERSLTALAFLFGVFRARPSPFYMLDEVEAALDDLNLHRFLDLVGEFRREAQLLVVSHQKRTMEAADVLYGVSMPPGGSSRVVSQRMSELVLEDA